MLNHITIMGRLTRDPELRYTQSQTPVATFAVACDRDFGKDESGNKQTDFIDCVAWRNTAEFVNKYVTKGSLVVVSGRLQLRDWTDKDGNKRRSAEVVADNVYFAESKRSSGESSYSAPARSAQPAPMSEQSQSGNGWSSIDDGDGELPF